MTTSHRSLLALFVAVLLFTGYNFIGAAWTPPTGAPPTANTAAPINVSSTTQSKAGNFSANIVVATTEMRSNRYCDALGQNCLMGGDGDSGTTTEQLWINSAGTVQTSYPVKINQKLQVVEQASAATPTGDINGELANIDFLKKLFTNVYGYTDYGNMRDSQAVPQVNYSSMREFYHADQATADYLCQHIGYDKGTWSSVSYSGGSGWAYHNLSIVTYDPNRGTTNSYANAGQRFMCFGASSCSANAIPFINNLRCLASAENPLQEKIFSEVYLPASQVANFKVNITTKWVATSVWGACRYEKRSDNLDYATYRTVRCHDSATNTYVADNRCASAPLDSWEPHSTLAKCQTFVTNQNQIPPHKL